MLDVNLSRLAGGELQEKFNREVTKVVQNMQDPNTPSGKERSITIRLSFKQTEFRDDAKIEISVSSKLASGITTKTNFAMGRDLETGEVVVSEYGKQIPGQMSLDIEPAEGTGSGKVARMPRQLRA